MTVVAERVRTAPRASRRRTSLVSLLRWAGAIGLSVVLLWWLVPQLTGSAWSTLVQALRGVTLPQVLVLSVVWLLGMWAHTFVLTAALPGLSHRRALTLNFTGSAVANMAPMGGAMGIATNLAMTRAWSFRDSAFAVYTLVTNLWDVLAKLVVPVVALVALLAADGIVPPGVRSTAAGVVAVMVPTLLLVVMTIFSDRVAVASARWTERVLRLLLPGRLAARAEGVEQALLSGLRESRAVIRGRWGQLSLGMTAYVVLQGVLFWCCLHVLGVSVGLAVLLAGFAVDRLFSMALITPGGAGFAEGAAIATMVALGGPAVGVAAAVLLYRAFIFALEIPVGGVWLGGWLLARARVRARAVSETTAATRGVAPEPDEELAA